MSDGHGNVRDHNDNYDTKTALMKVGVSGVESFITLSCSLFSVGQKGVMQHTDLPSRPLNSVM